MNARNKVHAISFRCFSSALIMAENLPQIQDQGLCRILASCGDKI